MGTTKTRPKLASPTLTSLCRLLKLPLLSSEVGGGALPLPIMDYTGRLRPKGVPLGRHAALRTSSLIC